MLTKIMIAGVVLAACVGATTAPATATPPERFTEIEELHETWGSCGPDDELVADITVREDVTIFASGRGTLHLRFVGTVTRTGTGVVAKWAERQRDFEFSDGSTKVVGLLGKLVVPGGRGLTVAGHARIGPDGTITSVTPGLEELFELEETLIPTICDGLSG
jgi:hypothetical protein